MPPLLRLNAMLPARAAAVAVAVVVVVAVACAQGAPPAGGDRGRRRHPPPARGHAARERDGGRAQPPWGEGVGQVDRAQERPQEAPIRTHHGRGMDVNSFTHATLNRRFCVGGRAGLPRLCGESRPGFSARAAEASRRIQRLFVYSCLRIPAQVR